MDQFREPYLQMPKDYTGKMPFYLTYPMPNVYQTEKEYERDMERMKEQLISRGPDAEGSWCSLM